MFFKIRSISPNNAYFIPGLIICIIGGFGGANIAFIQNKSNTTIKNILHIFTGTIIGAIEGAFLGLIWPITIPVFIGSYLNK